MSESVFEIVDVTSDELYFPLAVFLTLEEAVAAILSVPNDQQICNEYNGDEGYEIIEVRYRAIGFSENGKPVFRVQRNSVYDENTDEYVWENKITLDNRE